MGYTPCNFYNWTDFGDSFEKEQEKKLEILYLHATEKGTYLRRNNRNNSRKCEYCKSVINTNHCPNCGASN